MKIAERIRKTTVREILTKIRTLSLVLLAINVIVLFVSAYSYILFNFTLGVDKIFTIVLVSFFLFVGYLVLGNEGY